jgi:urease beta subunit
MATSGKDTGIVGYNVQTAVDTKNHIIVAHDANAGGALRAVQIQSHFHTAWASSGLKLKRMQMPD